MVSFGLSNDDRKKYNTVSNKSKVHFVKQYLRTKKFNMHRQEEGEHEGITSPALPASGMLQLSYTMK